MTPAIIATGQFTYPGFYLLDTLAVNVELAFAFATTKIVRQEFDVAHVGYFCLRPVRFQKEFLFDERK